LLDEGPVAVEQPADPPGSQLVFGGEVVDLVDQGVVAIRAEQWRAVGDGRGNGPAEVDGSGVDGVAAMTR